MNDLTNNGVAYQQITSLFVQTVGKLLSINNDSNTVIGITGQLANRIAELETCMTHMIIKYPVDTILQYLNLNDVTKDVLIKYFVRSITMYNKANTFTVIYDFGPNTYKFLICCFFNNGKDKGNQTWAPTISVTMNDKELATYDIEKEFRSFNYTKLHKQGFLDNYITFTVKRDCLKLGMAIFIYFYVIKYKGYSINGLGPIIDDFRNHENIRAFDYLFGLSVDDFVNPIKDMP